MKFIFVTVDVEHSLVIFLSVESLGLWMVRLLILYSILALAMLHGNWRPQWILHIYIYIMYYITLHGNQWPQWILHIYIH